MTDTQTQDSGAALDLHVPQDPDGSVSAVMPLSWCFFEGSPTREMLKTQGFKNPYVLVTVRTRERYETHGVKGKSYYWVDRKAFTAPLTQGLVYVSFNRPGKSQVLVHIVDVPDHDTSKALRKHVKYVNEGGYVSEDRSLFSPGGLARYEDPHDYRSYGRTIFDSVEVYSNRGDSLTVEVPAEMFAPEPAEWRKRLVDRFFTSGRKVVDQCHFRRRFWFVALPLSPFYLFFANFSKVFYLIGAAMFAPRKLRWKTFLDPWAGLITISDSSPDTSSWFFSLPRDEQRRHGPNLRLSWRTPLSPLVWFVPGFIFAFITHATVHPKHNPPHHLWVHAPSFWKTLLLFDGVMFGAVAAVLICGLLANLLMALIGKLTDIEIGRDSRLERQRRAEEARRLRLIKQLEEMSCGTNPPPMSVGDLPRGKQTVYLRFTDLKTKVCKPFAR